MSIPRTALTVLADVFAPLESRHILDIGCGPGALARSLLKAGARVTGIDPLAETVSEARVVAPGARFEVADGAALPFAAGIFDGAVFLNSLHHVPGVFMGQALGEAARVTGPGRPVVVIEPLAEGSFFAVVRAVEDETEIRREAAAALAESVEAGTFTIVSDDTYERVEKLASVDDLMSRLVSVDPARAAAAAEKRAEVAAAFDRLAERDATGAALFRQPMRAVTLRVKG